MDEEFQESDVIFSDRDRCHDDISSNDSYFTEQQGGRVVRSKKNTNKKVTSSSLPVNINIPGNVYQFEEEYEDGEITPPHVIVGRRIPGKMAFSVCALKGRDLRRVRNSILRMTGFLET